MADKKLPESDVRKSHMEQKEVSRNKGTDASVPAVHCLEKQTEKESEQKNKDELMAVKVQELEKAFYAVRFYPVAVKENAKEEGIRNIKKAYEEGDDAVKQLVLYMVHEYLSSSLQLRMMKNFEFFKGRGQNQEPGQLRMEVYRSMFNYNTSVEGIIDIIRLLGELKGNADDAAKVLTCHFSFLGSGESEINRMLRNAIIEALGSLDSEYALRALLEYAKYSDDEKLLSRLIESLMEWDKKLDRTSMPQQDKEKLKARMNEIMAREQRWSHYG